MHCIICTKYILVADVMTAEATGAAVAVHCYILLENQLCMCRRMLYHIL